MRVLVTGISSTIGRLVAERLLARDHEVVGIDRRPWYARPDGIALHEVDVRKRGAEDVFRSFRPEGVIHMGTVTHFDRRTRDHERMNLQGTRAVFNRSAKYGAERVVFVGRHTYYGAAPDAPLFHREDEPPTSIGGFPELADLVAADLYAGSGLWRFPGMSTAVLRICYSLGPGKHGTLARFLSGKRIPQVLGFDPLFQFMHEKDVARAIVDAVENDLRGVFNVAGPPPLPLGVVIREAGRTSIPVPEPLLAFVLKRLKLPELSRGAIQHIKYPIVVDDEPFRTATGFEYKYDEDETIASFREAAPV
jgi:UDP-glucose 4-epimerase